MSGATGARGYLMQAMICLLDSLYADAQWSAFCIEPTDASEKVDILWRYPDHTEAVQVKSSQNQFGLSQVKAWASELEASKSADKYKLQLIGPCARDVAAIGQLGNVMVPPPRILDLVGLREQAAQRLDKYLEWAGYPRVPPFAREFVVDGLASRLLEYSTHSQFIARSDFNDQLSRWIVLFYSDGVSRAVAMQCDVLVDVAYLTRFDTPRVPGVVSPDEFHLVIPMTFVNGGIRTAVVEWVAARVQQQSTAVTKLYAPVHLVDRERFVKGRGGLHPDHISSHFSTFPVLPGQVAERTAHLSRQYDKGEQQTPIRWSNGRHAIDIFVKYRERPGPTHQGSLELDLDTTTLDGMRRGHIGQVLMGSSREIVL